MMEHSKKREAPFAKQKRGAMLRDIERAAAREFHQPRKAPVSGLLGHDDGSIEAFSKREALLAWREIEAARDRDEEEARARRASLDHWAFGITLDTLEQAPRRDSTTPSTTPSRVPQA
jgi:hypothetical protein